MRSTEKPNPATLRRCGSRGLNTRCIPPMGGVSTLTISGLLGRVGAASEIWLLSCWRIECRRNINPSRPPRGRAASSCRPRPRPEVREHRSERTSRPARPLSSWKKVGESLRDGISAGLSVGSVLGRLKTPWYRGVRANWARRCKKSKGV